MQTSERFNFYAENDFSETYFPPPNSHSTLQCLNLPPQLIECEVSIIIPARDEADRLPAALNAATKLTNFKGEPLAPRRYEIIVLANNCVDDTAEIARRWQKSDSNLPPVHVAEITLPPDEAHVGRARKILMDAAFQRFWSAGKRRGVIASTDGDTRVSETWMAAILAEIKNGADAVSGRILVDEYELKSLDDETRAFHLRDVGYRLLAAELEGFLFPEPHDSLPRHHQHFGANFAVTADAYCRAEVVTRANGL